MMDQADVTTSEKYRRIMEAYQGELEYGRTTEAYSEALPTTGQTVEFLRIGRTLLVYQTSDQETTGWFNPSSRTYEELPGKYRLEVANLFEFGQDRVDTHNGLLLGRGAGEIKELADDGIDALHLGFRAPDDVLFFLSRHTIILEQIQIPLDDTDRIADFVRNAGRKPADRG